jgi:hypothetical protein
MRVVERDLTVEVTDDTVLYSSVIENVGSAYCTIGTYLFHSIGGAVIKVGSIYTVRSRNYRYPNHKLIVKIQLNPCHMQVAKETCFYCVSSRDDSIQFLSHTEVAKEIYCVRGQWLSFQVRQHKKDNALSTNSFFHKI